MAEKVQNATLLAPTGGWNARDNLFNMPQDNALIFENLLSDSQSVTLRKGYTSKVTTSLTHEAWGLVPFRSSNGAQYHLISTSDSDLYKFDVSGSSYSYISSSYGGWYLEGVTFKDRVYCTGLLNTPFTWDGSAAPAGITYTRSDSGNVNEFRHVYSYKGRLYWTQRNSTKIWYPNDVDTIGGSTLYAFDVGSIFQRGGYIAFCASTARQSGDLSSELFVIVSITGEVLVYQGDWPGSSTWALIGRFFLAPTPERGWFKVANELYLVTYTGIVSVNSLLQDVRQGGQYVMLTDQIRNAWKPLATAWGPSSWAVFSDVDNQLWLYPSLLNAVTEPSFYVYDFYSKSWSLFKIQNWADARSAAADATGLYILANDTKDGIKLKLFQMNSSTSDGGKPISWSMSHAYTDFGDPSHKKYLKMIQPLVVAPSGVGVSVCASTEGALTANSDSVRACSLNSDGTTLNRAWFGMNENGYRLSLHYRGSNVGPMSILGTHITYQTGGIL